MPLGDFLRRRPADSQACPACGTAVPAGANFCPSCGVRIDDPDAQPLHIVDRVTGLFNERFIRPILEDELARAHRYHRTLGVLLIQARPAKASDADDAKITEQTLKSIAAAVAGTLRDVDTPGILSKNPPRLLAVLPDTDASGTAHAATRVLTSVNQALQSTGTQAVVGLVCVLPGQRVRGNLVIDSAAKSISSGRPEMVGR